MDTSNEIPKQVKTPITKDNLNHNITEDLFKEVCEITASSNMGLFNICYQMGVSYRAMRYYMEITKDATAKYARAKEDQADYLADEMLEISDDSSDDVLRVKKVVDQETGKEIFLQEENKEFTNRSKLRVDTRKWIAARLKPKKYGDKIDVTSNGEAITREISITPIISK